MCCPADASYSQEPRICDGASALGECKAPGEPEGVRSLDWRGRDTEAAPFTLDEMHGATGRGTPPVGVPRQKLVANQATLDGPHGGCGAVGRVEFAKNVLHMLLDRLDADVQRRTNLAIA